MDEKERVSAQLAQKLSNRGRVNEGRPEGGLSAASRELGIDRDKARRAVTIASISEEAKEEAIKAGIADNQSALLRVAGCQHMLAVACVHLFTRGSVPVSDLEDDASDKSGLVSACARGRVF